MHGIQVDEWDTEGRMAIQRNAWRHGCMEAWVDMWGQRDVWRYEGKHRDTEGDMEEARSIEQANMK